MAPLVQTMPDDVIQKIDHALTLWLEAASKSIRQHESILLDLCRRVLALPLETGSGTRTIRNGVETYDVVSSAINHPIGHVTQALINLWFKRNPNDNDLLPQDLKGVFTELCDMNVERFRHARVLLGSHLIAFFRVDRSWTEQHLLPLFSWSNPVEAKALWEGFLWSPRLHEPLLVAIKPQLLESAKHYGDLGGELRQQFAAFLTYAALERTEGYSVEEFRSAIRALPQEGLERSAQAFSQALEGAGEQREEYWRNRAMPFWQQIWPKSSSLATPQIAESLAHLAINARGEFSGAFAAVQDWLCPIEHPDYVVDRLYESGLCKQFPDEALAFLDALIDEQPWVPQELGRCLDEIELAQDPRCQRLREYMRRRN